MSIGQMDRLVTIQTPSTSGRGSAGSVTESWTGFTTGWGRVQPLQGRELFLAQQKYGEVSHRIEMWHEMGVRPDMRVLFPRIDDEIATAVASSTVVSFVLSGNNNGRFPRVPFRARAQNEIVNVTSISSNTWTVTRAKDGTTASTHSTGTVIESLAVCDIIAVITPDESNEMMQIMASERV